MIITDKTNVNWYYIKIPRTATKSYTSLMDPAFARRIQANKFHPQGHSPYFFLSTREPTDTKYFTVVRNPVERFRSSLQYMAYRRQISAGIDFTLPCDTLPNLINFFYENFDRNCVVKTKTLEEIFEVPRPWFVGTFFQTQVWWAGHPDIKVFRYENLPELNTWLSAEFNLDTRTIAHIGAVEHDVLAHLDFTDPDFIKLVEHLFYEDFQMYNYPLLYS